MIKLIITLESKDETSFSVVQNREDNNANWRETALFRMFRDATATVAEKLIAVSNGSADAVVASSDNADIVNSVMRQAKKDHDKKHRKKKGE